MYLTACLPYWYSFCVENHELCNFKLGTELHNITTVKDPFRSLILIVSLQLQVLIKGFLQNFDCSCLDLLPALHSLSEEILRLVDSLPRIDQDHDLQGTNYMPTRVVEVPRDLEGKGRVSSTLPV
jgi:hypothetical protein